MHRALQQLVVSSLSVLRKKGFYFMGVITNMNVVDAVNLNLGSFNRSLDIHAEIGRCAERETRRGSFEHTIFR